MNNYSLLTRLTELNIHHRRQLMVLDFYNENDSISEVKVSIYSFPIERAVSVAREPVHEYMVTRSGHDVWEVKTLKGG